jgi:hypothetical protein
MGNHPVRQIPDTTAIAADFDVIIGRELSGE